MNTSLALLNESLCDHLLSTGMWNDWVVTTAFYSARYFIESCLFPLTLGSDSYADFDEYYLDRNKHDDFSRDSHQSRITLVHKKMKSAHDAYKFLYEASISARYDGYQVDIEEARIARSRLALIKKCCLPETTTTPIKT
ncbi:MAG: hypothetical protein Q8916_06120 [Bacteroidota bacterium]|nr:hypothetical protein [Bacteroidota bacterium]MDP4229965.1 hypothetical protein [Bacteroidota bacterium]MDP4235672.1 hypothetical protein [Bacteroidota bacterium]